MAYTTATLKQKDAPLPDGRVRVVITFTGNAGEPVIDRDYMLDASTTALDLRKWAIAEAANLLGRKTISDSLTLGQSINLTPIPPPTPTAAEIAEQVWLEKAKRLVRFRALGLTNATAVSNLAALQADVDSTYLAAYADKV